jgi:hypothetical protein
MQRRRLYYTISNEQFVVIGHSKITFQDYVKDLRKFCNRIRLRVANIALAYVVPN